MADGGFLIPPEVADEIMRTLGEANPFSRYMGQRPPLTRWQRMRLRLTTTRWAVVGWLHDRMFGRGYCNHDGCEY